MLTGQSDVFVFCREICCLWTINHLCQNRSLSKSQDEEADNKRRTEKDEEDSSSHNIPTQTPELLMMESAIGVPVSQFKAYAGSDGSTDTLSRDELCRLVKAQLPNFVKNAGHPAAVHQLMRSLDANDHGELNFLQFWQLIGHHGSKRGGFSQ